MADERTKFLLSEDDIPTHWVNLLPELPGDPLPPLHPGTMSPAGPAPPKRSTSALWSPPPAKHTSWLSRAEAAASPAACAWARVSALVWPPTGNQQRSRISAGTDASM